MIDTKHCYVCGTTNNLHRHHILFGSNRKNSEKYKDCCTVWLCQEHHEGPQGVHGKYGHELDQELKKLAQQLFEEKYSHEKWMEVFGRNYKE